MIPNQAREWAGVALVDVRDGVLVVDRNEHIEFLNPAASEMTGWTDAVGRPLSEVFRLLHETTHQVLAVRRAEQSRALEHPALLVARNGSERPVEGTVAPCSQGMIIIFRDLTERRRADELRGAEEWLRQRYDDLNRAASQKDEFLAMLAHELRNPLAPLRNALQILRLTHGAGDSLDHAIEVMERQLHNLVRLVDDLLDVSRLTRGKVALRRERVELATIVNQAVETTRPLIDACHHQLEVHVSPAPIWLDADLPRLEQALANLLNNAARYTEPGGRIRVTAGREGDAAVVRVRDSGMGIAPELLPHVFDLFTQADRALDRSQGGLGIGLTLVKRLVELHGGTVGAASEGSGKGSEFLIRLPLLPGTEAPADTTSPVRHGDKENLHRRILVVDDNRDAVESLALLLELWGHEVRTAADGPSSLVVARRFHPDVVLLDIGLPELDGYEVARLLRREHGAATPVLVATTGYGQPEDRRRAQDAGFAYHFVKPVDPEALRALLAGRDLTALGTLTPGGAGTNAVR